MHAGVGVTVGPDGVGVGVAAGVPVGEGVGEATGALVGVAVGRARVNIPNAAAGVVVSKYCLFSPKTQPVRKRETALSVNNRVALFLNFGDMCFSHSQAKF